MEELKTAFPMIQLVCILQQCKVWSSAFYSEMKLPIDTYDYIIIDEAHVGITG
jgi:type I site-specific restriction endonuclease